MPLAPNQSEIISFRFFLLCKGELFKITLLYFITLQSLFNIPLFDHFYFATFHLTLAYFLNRQLLVSLFSPHNLLSTHTIYDSTLLTYLSFLLLSDISTLPISVCFSSFFFLFPSFFFVFILLRY